ncbi:MAG: DNA primase [Dialister sp.]|nr:DNA primase [Dialister sp.]
MPSFPNDFIQRVKDSTNIVDLIGSYVSLKKKGKKYWACCPFHNEKTPSFSVDGEDGYFYCFGCHAGGDAISFLEKIDGLSFSEAVERLAEAAHIDIPERKLSPEEAAQAQLVNKLYDVYDLACTYFHNCLTQTRMGKAGLSYFMEARHLSKETIEAFQLGFAPDAWQRLYLDFTEKKHIDPALLIEARLVGEKNGRCYDMFRNRCMFPILNIRGRVVAFGGRVMDDSKPKYLNSPETRIFNKRQLLFALYQAIPAIRKTKQAIMVEGYMDAISLHAHGITNAVASLGTSFTIEQARLLKRYADEVVFSYDMDAAGQNATRRALEIAASAGLSLRVAAIPDGKDPDEFVNAHGPEAYLSVIKKAKSALDYLFNSLLGQYDSATLEGQQHILEEMFAVLSLQENSFQFNHFIRRMARRMHMDEGLIRSEAMRYTKKHQSGIYISKARLVKDETPEGEPIRERRKSLEEGLLRYCITYRRLPDGVAEFESYPFSDAFNGRLFSVIKALGEGNITRESVEGALSREEVERLASLLMQTTPLASVPMEAYIRPLRKLYLQEEYRTHTQRVSELLETNPEAAREEQMICIRLSKEIRKLGD